MPDFDHLTDVFLNGFAKGTAQAITRWALDLLTEMRAGRKPTALPKPRTSAHERRTAAPTQDRAARLLRTRDRQGPAVAHGGVDLELTCTGHSHPRAALRIGSGDPPSASRTPLIRSC